MNYNIKLELNNLIAESKDFDDLKIKLKENIPDIYIKVHNNLALIANKYKINNFNISELEAECKNIIIDKNTLELIVYSYNSIYYNDEANHFLLNNEIDKNYTKEILESYEGTSLMIYNNNDKWYVSTRKCLDSNESLWNPDKSYYNLFCECINTTFEEFTKNLNKNYYYFFILIHHNNMNLVDYSDKFGKDYKNIIHIMTRERSTHKEIDLKDRSQFNSDITFINPNKLDNYDLINDNNKKDNIILPITLEGIIVKLTHNITNKTILLKFHTNAYKILNKLKPNFNNILKTFVALYKKELLREHLIYFPNNINIKLFDKKNELEFDTIGIIDALFKVITSELFELFKLLYNLRDCSHKNKDLYDTLPNEYKIILYKIRGLYFEKKDSLSKIKNKDINFNYKNYNLKIIDIYTLLKEYDIELFFKLLKSRLSIFKDDKYDSISNRCDYNSLNMTNIFINNI